MQPIKNHTQLFSALLHDIQWNKAGKAFLESFSKKLFDNRSNLPNYQQIKGPNEQLRELATDVDIENQKIREFLFVAHECDMVERNFQNIISDDSLPGLNMYALTLYRQGSASYEIGTDRFIDMKEDDRLFNFEVSELCFRSAIFFDKYWAPAYVGVITCCINRRDYDSTRVWYNWFNKCYSELKKLDFSINENKIKFELMDETKPIIYEMIKEKIM